MGRSYSVKNEIHVLSLCPQAKLHQKLLDVQHQMRMRTFDLRIPTTSPIAVPASNNTAPLSPPPTHPSPHPHSPLSPSQVTNELARQEKTHSKVIILCEWTAALNGSVLCVSDIMVQKASGCI